MTTETTTEFAVDLTCSKCVKATEDVLKSSKEISNFKVDLKGQYVVITSTKSTNDLKSIIESTGKRAVVLGTEPKKVQENRLGGHGTLARNGKKHFQ